MVPGGSDTKLCYGPWKGEKLSTLLGKVGTTKAGLAQPLLLTGVDQPQFF